MNNKDCSVENCKDKYYAKGYCSKHYNHNLIYGFPRRIKFINVGKKCKIKDCDKLAFSMEYCRKHYRRFYIHGNPFIVKPNAKGKDNHMWRGGIAEYPNHYDMKKARLEKIKQTKGKCEICGKKGFQIHHIDRDKSNHSLENLIFICIRCHKGVFHKNQKYKSKFRNLYGNSIVEISNLLKKSCGTICRWHCEGTLKNKLQVLTSIGVDDIL